MAEQKPDADFESVKAYNTTWDDGYTAGFDEGRQERTDLTLAGAILIALIAGALGFVFGMAVAAGRLL